MVKNYIPSQGDIVYINFSPQQGKEQKGLRPALIMSPYSYNKTVGLALMCPITKQQKNYPFEVEISNNEEISGVVLSDHIKNLDWKSRDAKFITKMDEEGLKDVLEKLSLLLSHF